ncbi:MAG: hypothetical protein IKC63_03135, partial [Clostridia bacterium]|nr:hypothetical protein [Clostridia bacterium]
SRGANQKPLPLGEVAAQPTERAKQTGIVYSQKSTVRKGLRQQYRNIKTAPCVSAVEESER